MTAEQISIIDRIIEKTIADEISWKRESQYLIGKDEDGYTYCLQPHIDMSEIDSPSDIINKLKAIVHNPQCPQISIFGDKGDWIIKASMIPCEVEETESQESAEDNPENKQERHLVIKEIIDPRDKERFDILTSEALCSLVRLDLQ